MTTSRVARPPRAVRRLVEPPIGFRWEGIIFARAWPDGFTEDEYRLMLVGGRRHRLARPDAVGAAGQPIFHLTDYERRAKARLLDGKCLDRHEAHNVACNAGRTVLLNLIAGAAGYGGVSYFAVGTGTPINPDAGDVQLVTEGFRKALSGTTISGNQIDLSTLFATTEANLTYTEAGLFGNGATATANSGTLFAHAAYAYQKSSSINLTNDYVIFLN